MESLICTSFISILLLILPVLFLFWRSRRGASKRLPPGSMGLPLIGHSLGLLRSMRANKGEDWLQERVRKYGPVSKLGLFGYPTVFLHGQAANKFIYTCDGTILGNQQPPSMSRIFGEKNILELAGEDHKRVRAALVSFLNPEVLKKNISKIDEEIRIHLQMHWHGKQEVKVMPLMKTLTFNIICSLIFGIERGSKRDQIISVCQDMIAGVLSVPINLPFTQFNRSVRASNKMKAMVLDLIAEKRLALNENRASPHQDLITCLLSIGKEDNSKLMSDKEILDNIVLVMLVGHDTTSGLLTFLVRLLADNPSIYSAVVEEQEAIANSKSFREFLTWDDLTKMKYTWRVAMETLRMTPPVFCTFRRTLKDIEYGGYIIPKGWQVFWSTCMTHMDEKIFPDPSKFDPTRFEQQAPAPAFSYVPFRGGPKICPGYEFAKIETLAMNHYLVTQFTWNFSLEDNSFGRDPMPVFNQGRRYFVTTLATRSREDGEPKEIPSSRSSNCTKRGTNQGKERKACLQKEIPSYQQQQFYEESEREPSPKNLNKRRSGREQPRDLKIVARVKLLGYYQNL